MTQAHTTYLVGIGGGTASGKSTFTRALVQTLETATAYLNVTALGCDRFFRFGTPEMPTIDSPTFGVAVPDFNHPDSLDIERILNDLDTLRQAPETPDIIIIEGHLLLHWPEIRDRLDLRLFIELDADTRALRRLVRNIGHAYDPIPDHSPQAIASYYLESAKTGHARYIEPTRVYADLILRGDADFDRTAPMVAALIVAHVQKRKSRAEAQ